MKKIHRIIKILPALLVQFACDDYLDAKPDQSLLVPTELEDVQNLLDNIDVFNRQPVLNIIAGDEFFVSQAGLTDLSNSEQGSHHWMDDPYQGDRIDDWFIPYQQIFYANVSLNALKEMPIEEEMKFNRLKGEALFHRAHAYYHLLQEFAPPYSKEGGNSELLGVIVKDKADVNEKAKRSSLDENYRQLVDDLLEAADLLPDFQILKTRPSKAAALGMLGRIYLTMFDYENAASTALQALEIYSDRLDFNEIDVSVSRPFSQFGEETVFYSEMISVRFNSSPQVFIDTLLAKSYGDGDLRFEAYFDEVNPNRFLFRGKLTGNSAGFGGIGVGELELIAAEGLARVGKHDQANNLLNALLKRRIANSAYEPVNESGQALLSMVLEERRRELVGRGLRWTDLRRLNQYRDYAKVLERQVNSSQVILQPNSPKYVFPIPDEEILFTGIKQNER